VRYGLLGTVEVRPDPDDAPLDLGSPLQRVLLGLLLTERDRSVSLDRIVEELWGEAAPADPEGSVHTYVSRLRRVLEPGRSAGAPARVLLRTPAGYRLAVPPDGVDADRFARLAADARSAGDPAAALRAAEEALALWRGPVALEDAGEREFAVQARGRLDSLRVSCEEDRLAALLALGRPQEVVPGAEALVVAHPLRERPWVLLIDALHATGRTADALARYAEVHRLLDDELGVQPGPALREAQARALRGEPAARPLPAPALVPAAAPEPAGRPEIVGREREVAELATMVAGLPRSGPRFVLVDGEAGIGKSRLAAEVTAGAAAGGARVAWGRCHEDDDAPALWPWHQVMAALTDGAAVALAAPDEGAFAAFERVLRTLVEASAERSVVVVVDDLHWADPASLRMLSFLAVELQHGPIAVVTTCRAEVRDPGVAQVRATLARTPGFLHVPLGPLSRTATRELVERVTAAPLDDAAIADLHERSGGNPFFATELARVADDAAVPPGVRDVVERRLAALPEGTRAVLQLAAAAGQRFDVALLERAGAGRDAGADTGSDSDAADALADALDAAQAADLVREVGPGRLTFAHALLRESLLDSTTSLRRSRLHARLAAALPESTDVYERAHQLVSGRPFTDAERTVAACAAAARRAVADHAHENAARWWERALAVLDEAAGGQASARRQDLLFQAGESLARAGSWAAAHELLTAAIGTALDSGDLDAAATAAEQLCHVGGIWFPVAYGDYPAGLVERLEALVAAIGGVDGPARVRALSTLASVVHYGPDPERGPREAVRALQSAQRTGRPELVRTALDALVTATWVPGHEEELIAAATQLVELATAAGAPETAIAALARCAATRLSLGDVEGDADDLARAWELAQGQELPLVQSQLISFQAARATLHGEFELALELIDRAWALMQRTQLYAQNWTDLAMRAFVWVDQGCLGERLPQALPEELTAETTPVGAALLQAIAYLQAGQPAAAAELMAAQRAWDRYPMQWDWVSLTCFQGHIAAALVAAPEVDLDPAIPAAIADRLQPYAGQLAVQGGIGALGPVPVYLGRVEAAAGRTAAAEAHLREGIEIAERHGFRPPLARGHLALAELLAGRGARQESADNAAAALRIAESIGMAEVARQAARLAHE
jgi:DNA-binding SARP family transcriptional activator